MARRGIYRQSIEKRAGLEMRVVDATVWLSRLVPQDPRHTLSRDWLAQYVLGGNTVLAPATLLSEIAGLISRQTGDARLGRRVVNKILRVPVLRVVSIDRRLAWEATELASELGLTGRDAMYVALARLLGVPLVTWSEAQRARASEVITVQTP